MECSSYARLAFIIIAFSRAENVGKKTSKTGENIPKPTLANY